MVTGFFPDEFDVLPVNFTFRTLENMVGEVSAELRKVLLFHTLQS